MIVCERNREREREREREHESASHKEVRKGESPRNLLTMVLRFAHQRLISF